MTRQTRTVMLVALLGCGLVAHPAMAGGTPEQKCAAKKRKSSGKDASGQFGCFSKAAAKGTGVDTACTMKADGKFTAAFQKADSKAQCEGTASSVGTAIANCIGQVSQEITGTGKCQAAKFKAAGKKAAGMMKCYAKAATTGTVDSGCTMGASDSFSMAFASADGSAPCPGDKATVETEIDNNCVTAVVQQTPPVAPGCGNGIVDPGETCDDGNTVNGDSCPANCVIQSCTVNTGTHQGVSLRLTTPAGVTVGGLTLLLDYPEGHVRMPVTTPGSNVIDTPNDQIYELKDPLIDSTGTDGIPANGAGPMLQVMFDGCQGQALPTVADYKCTIIDAADENGASIDLSTLGCAVTIP